jgi:type I restriction enzyme S subunit
MQYLQIPKDISFKDLTKKKSFSPSEYKTVPIANKNVKKISELIIGDLTKGEEVGSFSYISKSRFFFLRTKALQTNKFLIKLDDSECAVPILPHAFISHDLKRGDILLSKDSNVGEVAILDEDIPNFMLSGAIFRLRFNPRELYYIFSFLKTEFFKSQINIMIARGATIKHAGTVWLDALIPFPNSKNSEDIVSFISLLTKAIIRKESEIRSKYALILGLIDQELRNNQLSNKFVYSYPSIVEINSNKRIDAGMFCERYKQSQFIISNYNKGTTPISKSEFDYKRGQNLQISQIGKSIYTAEYESNFYKLIRPFNLSDYGTIDEYEYLGNKNELQTLNEGEVIFSGEGTVGKFTVILESGKKTITNIHGITFYPKNKTSITESIFLGLFLGYLKSIGILDYISVGGQGGSLSGKWSDHLYIPNFGQNKKEELTRLYNKKEAYDVKNLTLKDFETEDLGVTEKSGVYQLDMQIKLFKDQLNKCIDLIIEDKPVPIDFDFLTGF